MSCRVVGICNLDGRCQAAAGLVPSGSSGRLTQTPEIPASYFCLVSLETSSRSVAEWGLETDLFKSISTGVTTLP